MTHDEFGKKMTSVANDKLGLDDDKITLYYSSQSRKHKTHKYIFVTSGEDGKGYVNSFMFSSLALKEPLVAEFYGEKLADSFRKVWAVAE